MSCLSSPSLLFSVIHTSGSFLFPSYFLSFHSFLLRDRNSLFISIAPHLLPLSSIFSLSLKLHFQILPTLYSNSNPKKNNNKKHFVSRSHSSILRAHIHFFPSPSTTHCSLTFFPPRVLRSPLYTHNPPPTQRVFLIFLVTPTYSLPPVPISDFKAAIITAINT